MELGTRAYEQRVHGVDEGTNVAEAQFRAAVTHVLQSGRTHRAAAACNIFFSLPNVGSNAAPATATLPHSRGRDKLVLDIFLLN
ncbi:hypothetical protein NL676_031206 [Syzygium grande]|nr:hypothetical protein NL676_031206 [Syzygium grande]